MSQVECPTCKGRIEFASTLVGKVVSCPHCQHPLVMPDLGTTAYAKPSRPPVIRPQPMVSTSPHSGRVRNRRSNPLSSSVIVLLCLAALGLPILCCGFGAMLSPSTTKPTAADKPAVAERKPSTEPEPERTYRPSAERIRASDESWWQGGSLHSATIAEWKAASDRNKLATAADWLSATVWKGHLNSPQDFDRLKVKAESLVAAVDEGTRDVEIPEMKVNEVAAAIMVLANDLRP